MSSKLTDLYLPACFACVACMAISCSSDSPVFPVAGEMAEVTFDVKDITRATSTTSFDHFAVYGDMKYTKDSNPVPEIIFDKTLVTHSNGKWSYNDTQHWFNDHEHSFVAIYPLPVLEADRNLEYSDSKLSFTYNLPLDDEGKVNDKDVTDIVSATHRRLYIYDETSPASPISLQFSHLLSQINFSVELTDQSTRSEEYVKIHRFEMTGFGTSATINVEPASLQSNTQTNDSKIDIVTAKGNGSLTVTFDEPTEVINGAAAVKMFDDNNGIILLPQTFDANEEVQIRLTYSENDEPEETQVSATLRNFTWESGKSYNYNIKLELKEAKMVISNTKITPWDLIDDYDEVEAI